MKLGLVHRGIQFAVILYIFIYSIWLQQGYLEYSGVNGVLYSKVKGSAYTNTSSGITIYDNNDIVIPPLEADAIFILTGFINTYQTRDVCPSTTSCKSDSDCQSSLTPNGLILPSCNISAGGFCMIEGWCPLENDTAAAIVPLYGLENSTIFLRSSVNYFTFNIEQSDPTDPIPQDLFVLQNMLPGTTVSQCTTTGCIVTVNIDWTCDLDQGDCSPKTTFQLTPGGFNYRTVTYSVGQEERELQKLYGIRFLAQITGQGGRFSFFRMIITIGSGAAFFTVATLITDFILLLVFRKTMFEKKKWSHFALKSKEEEEHE